MIARTPELSSSQNAAASPASGCATIVQPSAQERSSSAMKMRNQLFLLDPSERRMSLEDYIAMMLEQPQSENQA